MKMKWNEKTKKIALVAGLVVVGILAVVGISFFIYKDTPQKVELVETAEPEDVVDIPEEKVSVPVGNGDTATTEEEIVVNTGIAEDQETENTYVQSMQPTPVKTEDQKPAEASDEESSEESAEGTKTGKADAAKKTVTQEQPSTERSAAPKHGDIQGDKIYFDGFGWVDYNGGETICIPAHDIYENGNKIGIMD